MQSTVMTLQGLVSVVTREARVSESGNDDVLRVSCTPVRCLCSTIVTAQLYEDEVNSGGVRVETQGALLTCVCGSSIAWYSR